ncbi:zinc finger CCCH-type antiviral protein 1-like [Crocuta crocuta]
MSSQGIKKSYRIPRLDDQGFVSTMPRKDRVVVIDKPMAERLLQFAFPPAEQKRTSFSTFSPTRIAASQTHRSRLVRANGNKAVYLTLTSRLSANWSHFKASTAACGVLPPATPEGHPATPGGRRGPLSTCTLSHDIHTPVNIQVLKNHGLFGLNEAQLRILLLQNDPCLLPEVCLLYNKGEALYGYCNMKEKCNKFHVCKSFVRGECRLQKCKRSHQLIHAASLKLLQDQGLSIPSVVNFQIISAYKHMKLHKMLENQENAASSAERAQGLEKPGGRVAGAAEASPRVPGPPQSAKKPHTGKP